MINSSGNSSRFKMTTPTAEAPASNQKFVRGLGLLDSTMLVAGSMIGSGIFIVSADIARLVGSAGWLLVVWAVTGVLTIVAALTYGELAAMMPRAGGQYVYLREAYSPLWGFLYGWTLFLVIQTGTIAAVAVAFARFLGVLSRCGLPDALDRFADHAVAGLCGEPFHAAIGRDSDHHFPHGRKHPRTGTGQIDPERVYLCKDVVAHGADCAGHFHRTQRRSAAC